MLLWLIRKPTYVKQMTHSPKIMLYVLYNANEMFLGEIIKVVNFSGNATCRSWHCNRVMKYLYMIEVTVIQLDRDL